MHYYKRNLGDYAKKAGRLSMLEHGAYTLLIDSCYDREQFPTLQQAIDWCWARSEAEIEAVTFVLNKFFTLEGEIYVQKRIQEELAEYHQKAIKNKEIATERENKRKEKARTVNEPSPQTHEAPPNHKPITNNHKPIVKDKSASRPPPKPDDVDQQVWDDWLQLRKGKKAAVTETVIAGAAKQAQIAGMRLNDFLAVWCRRGSQGLEAAWLKPEERRTATNRHTAGASAFFEGAEHV